MSHPHPHPPTTNLAPDQKQVANSYDFAVTARERLSALRAQEAAAATALIVWLPSYRARAAAITAQASALGLGDITTFSERLATVTTAFSALQEEAHVMQREYSTLQQEIHVWKRPSPHTTQPYPLDRHHPHCSRHATNLLPLAALESQLELSADFPLDISFQSHIYHAHDDTVLLQPLARHSNRWERLHISASMLPAIPEIRGNLAKLQYLHVVNPRSNREYPPNTDNIMMFAIAPQLREALLPRSPVLSVPWHQLTRVGVESGTQSLLELLPQLHHVTDCDLAVHAGDITSASDPIVILRRLRRLVLMDDRVSRFLETPNLESLEVVLHFAAVPDFLSRSGCHLKILKLRWCFSEMAAFGDVLRGIPTLTHLELNLFHPRGSPSKTELSRIPPQFDVLKATSNSTALCPALNSLSVRLPDNAGRQILIVGHRSLCEMVESRWNLPTSMRSLTRVYITPEGLASYSVWQRFQAMRRAGMDVNGLWHDGDEDDETQSDSVWQRFQAMRRAGMDIDELWYDRDEAEAAIPYDSDSD
ncbi:hypothetical protein B0H13DRAFT_1906495 [Mycena leptocephala]|nr:hypothetical protein B0H13DRAFT_1915914 [Mycena leptocephala]KAJ7849012.1 hypothetical protein B0H13DRAFT_1906495 [Mycena leptocephala]